MASLMEFSRARAHLTTSGFDSRKKLDMALGGKRVVLSAGIAGHVPGLARLACDR
jgi:hypothetical protein